MMTITSIEHKEIDEYSSEGTKLVEKGNIVELDNNAECQGEVASESQCHMKKGNIGCRRGMPICIICKMKCTKKENLMQHIKIK